METNRIKMKIGDAEFEAEGSSEIITKQFDAFMKAVDARSKQAPVPAAITPATQALNIESPVAPIVTPTISGVSQDILDRVFRQGDHLSLAALPHGENADSDAMLAILYGFLKLMNENAVTGTALMKSAKISGVNIGRVDRIMGLHIPDYVLVAGVKKARRYQLNNRGIAKAEEIIRAVLQ